MVMGTVSRGRVQDKSDKSESYLNEQVKYTLCYLMPQNLDLLNDPAYYNLRYHF